MTVRGYLSPSGQWFRALASLEEITFTCYGPVKTYIVTMTSLSNLQVVRFSKSCHRLDWDKHEVSHFTNLLPNVVIIDEWVPN